MGISKKITGTIIAVAILLSMVSLNTVLSNRGDDYMAMRETALQVSRQQIDLACQWQRELLTQMLRESENVKDMKTIVGWLEEVTEDCYGWAATQLFR